MSEAHKSVLAEILKLAKKKMGQEGPEAPMTETSEPEEKTEVEISVEPETEGPDSDSLAELHKFLKSRTVPAPSERTASHVQQLKKTVGKPFPKKA